MAAVAIPDSLFGCKIDGFASKKGKHRDFIEGAGDKSPQEQEAFFHIVGENVHSVLRPGALAYRKG